MERSALFNPDPVPFGVHLAGQDQGRRIRIRSGRRIRIRIRVSGPSEAPSWGGGSTVSVAALERISERLLGAENGICPVQNHDPSEREW
jgi:hypothetical protein